MKRVNAGTFGSRLLITILGILLGCLIYWLLDFVLVDIGSMPGPDYQRLEATMVDQKVLERSLSLERQINQTNRRIQDERARQATLRDSTDSSQRTLNQLLELQRLNLQAGTNPNEQERAALVESEQLFLENQREYQRLNQQVRELEEEVRQLEASQIQVHQELAALRGPVRTEYQRLDEQFRLRVALYKLAVLLPLMLIALGLYLRYRAGFYWSLIYSFGIAVMVKSGFVMHQYFPARYFKYILMGSLLLVTLKILLYLIRSRAYPKKEWLLKQYREAYEAFLCPFCELPIRRGPLKYLSWTRRSVRWITVPGGVEHPDEVYTCPACAAELYGNCPHCGKVRHTLLPACVHCGSINELGDSDALERPTVAAESAKNP